MKKIILVITSILLSAAALSAQDLAQATETFNNGAAALSAGNKADALNSFKAALATGLQCGEDGAELVTNCKNAIPTVMLSLAKDDIKSAAYDKAIAQLTEVAKVAKEYANADIATEASELIPQVLMQKGSALLTAKDYEGAIAVYKDIVAADATNGMAALRLGMAYNAAGKLDEAKAALTAAAENGQAANANKQLSTINLKEASNFLKAKDYANAMKSALASAEFAPSANAYKVAGTAATNLGKVAEAIEYLSKYLEVSPKAADAVQITAAIEALKKQQK